MTENARLLSLLRAAVPPVVAAPPAHDVWRRVVERSKAERGFSWVDLGLAAAAVAVLLLRPDLLVLLTYHL